MRVVGVMGSGSQAHAPWSVPLGRRLAESNVHLLTGGGGGTMAAVAQAFVSVRPRTGLSIGVLPGDEDGRAPDGYPNPFVELAIRTHLPARGADGAGPRSRNHINVLTADALVILPGGLGTRSEALLAARYGRKAVLFGPRGAFDELPARCVWTDAIDRVLALALDVPVTGG